MRRLLPAALPLLLLAGCGEPRTVGPVQVQGEVATYDYYGEFRDEKRIYLLRTPDTVANFAAGNKEMPLSKTLIGKGPNKETLVIESLKEPDVSKIETARLIRTFNARNNANVAIP